MTVELRIANLVKEFDSLERSDENVVAVDNVSLKVESGELVTLLGPSGCGKTTLLRMIAGFEDPTRGDIYFDQLRVNDIAPNKRNTTLVFQSYAIFPHLSVYENIAFGLRERKIPKPQLQERMETVLELVGLKGLEKRSPDQLSGGQQQRVALARAIVIEPQLLLFDEPLSNLDAKLREQMRIEIRHLQQRLGITSVYVTHDQAEAMSISDRVIIMNKGHIEQVGTPQELYGRPANRFVAAFVGKANFLQGQMSSNHEVEVANQLLTLSRVDPNNSTGDKVMITVRPESIDLHDDLEAADTHFRGKIARTTFLGGMVEYEVSVPGLDNLIVHVSNPILNGLYTPGTEIGLHIPKAALHLIPLE